jgi:uncharacterized membrane protein YccF (DUF307 family)
VGLVYTLLLGFPLCVVLVTFGPLLCVTVIGLPFGIALIGLGCKYLTLPHRHFV